MGTRTDARFDSSEGASAPVRQRIGAAARRLDGPVEELDPTTRKRALLLADDVLATMGDDDARCVMTIGPRDVRVEVEGRMDVAPGTLALVCWRADRWGMSLGQAGRDLVWFELVS